MSKFFNLLIILLLLTMFKSSLTKNSNRLLMNERSSDNDDDDDNHLEDERRTYDLNRLRHFLLTANAEQRAARREEQEFHKRELIREYLQSLSDPNPERYQEVRKRFKTYCNSYEDLMNSNWATCG